MDEIINFKNEKLNREARKIYKEFLMKDELTLAIETYENELYFNACGQSKDYAEGWIKGVEYMMGFVGLNYKDLRQEVKAKIEANGRTIINTHWFEED